MFGGGFDTAIWPIIRLGQFFGLLPVQRLFTSDYQFKWTSRRAMYSVLMIGILTTYNILLAYRTFYESTYSTIGLFLDLLKLNLSNPQSFLFCCFFAVLLSFYLSNTCGMICFLRLAISFPELMKLWRTTEENVPGFKNHKQRKDFVFKIRCVAFFILFIAACTVKCRNKRRLIYLHEFPLIAVENIASMHSKYLLVIEEEKDKDPISEIINLQSPLWYIGDSQPYPVWAIVFAKCINIIAVFTFNYIDIFVTTFSFGLSTLFKLFNHEMNRAKNQV